MLPDHSNLAPTNKYWQVSLPSWSELAELRKLLCPKLEPYFTEGKVQGVKVSLASSLALHLRRLIQTGQAPFLTAISRPGGFEGYRLASNMPKSQKSRKPLQAKFLSLLLY